MRVIFFHCLFFFVSMSAYASPQEDSLITELNRTIQKAKSFDQLKERQISTIKAQLKAIDKAATGNVYALNLKLYEEYKYYNYDSALMYTGVLQDYARLNNDPSLIADSKLKASFILLSAGLFVETFEALKNINTNNLNDTSKAEFYSLFGRSYYNLADYTNDGINTPVYNEKANAYLDSALSLYPVASFEYAYYEALKFLKKGETDSALQNLNLLTLRKGLSYHQVALATSTLGGIYMSRGEESQAKPYLIKASIADIRSSTKETLALLVLAGIIYKEGSLEDALLYIGKANSDAEFYNARLRKAQIGAVLPLIQGDLIETINSQKHKQQQYLIALSLVVLLLAGFALVIRNQVKKLKLARQKLVEANVQQQQVNQQLLEANKLKETYNQQLVEMNDELTKVNEVKEKYNEQLQVINQQLGEANKIKEEYIGYYFNIDTELLGRIEKLIANLDKKLDARKWDEMRFLLKSVDLKKEKEELLKNFDKVFIRLFPNFVAEFNNMFAEEDKIVLKDGQLLNAELRIYALIRLGITENEKIAEILDYSINTIYAKKTKLRSKTIIFKDEFERKLMENTTINL